MDRHRRQPQPQHGPRGRPHCCPEAARREYDPQIPPPGRGDPAGEDHAPSRHFCGPGQEAGNFMTSQGTPAPHPSGAGTYAGTFGAVALAAYKPDQPMFARQLLSIQAQTHTDFVCLISVDGDYQQVADMVRQICGGDERFQVLGYSSRLGFHHNFERALKAVPKDARWVALSDQDDYWCPGKLAALLPRLDGAALVTGQARVVSPE